MQLRKIFEILLVLDKPQLKRFDDFVHSPYFNKHEQVCRLWDYLKFDLSIDLFFQFLI